MTQSALAARTRAYSAGVAGALVSSAAIGGSRMKRKSQAWLAAFALAAFGFGFGVQAASSAPPDKALCSIKVCQDRCGGLPGWNPGNGQPCRCCD
ncbi:conserved hypothetical protein [Lysobacter enzymogenes]|uniref:Uncharacterized protein n=2 Tax=Lysobacter enzymogenes TaxID=69 RepID=A0AAU9AFK0_LYSEN|nr:conserved hypothetical protein [Lysobacter enzymogenes]